MINACFNYYLADYLNRVTHYLNCLVTEVLNGSVNHSNRRVKHSNILQMLLIRIGRFLEVFKLTILTVIPLKQIPVIVSAYLAFHGLAHLNDNSNDNDDDDNVL